MADKQQIQGWLLTRLRADKLVEADLQQGVGPSK